jgi:hypothetical protein
MDLHDRFAGWVTAGARDELPRDVALHASGCGTCLGIAAAVDALALVDPGEADMPPVRVVVGHDRAGRPIRAARAGIAAVAVVITVAAGFVAGGTLFERVPESIADVVSPTPAGAVLGGQGSPAATPTTTASASAEEESVGPSPSASATDSPVPGPNPTMGGGPPPVVPGTPAPSAAPTAPQTATPTPSPTPVAPSATPSPSCPVRLPACPTLSPVPLP